MSAKFAIVFGGSRGIGAAIALRLAKDVGEAHVDVAVSGVRRKTAGSMHRCVVKLHQRHLREETSPSESAASLARYDSLILRP